ncbi:MFS transporter [Mycetocola reblochoni]|nr:MFS transporter [Mycetocola reblochoni]
MATWASRLPAIRTTLDVGTDQLGLVILAMSVGSVIGITQAPGLLGRWGSRGTMRVVMLLVVLGVAGIALGSLLGSLTVVAVALFVFGFGNGCLDVAMNVDGAAAEGRLGRTIMPLLHACFSLGTLCGAALGSLAALVGLPAGEHLLIVAVVLALIVAAVLRFVPLEGHELRRHANGTATAGTATEQSTLTGPIPLAAASGTEPVARRSLGERLAVWRDPSLLLIGVIMLGMAFAEGSANDWLALAVVDGHGQAEATGAAVFAVFVGSMFVGRLLGGPVVDRIGRVPALRWSALLATVGLGVFIVTDVPALFVLGTVLWGLGASLGFPLGISAAADGPGDSTARVGAVSIIGYIAFLVGPPGIGILGEHVGILTALVVVLVLIVLSGLAAPAARERRGASD